MPEKMPILTVGQFFLPSTVSRGTFSLNRSATIRASLVVLSGRNMRNSSPPYLTR